MLFEIKRASGLPFSVDTVDIKEFGEHETGGTYICMADGSSMLLEQDYAIVKRFLSKSDEVFQPEFTLMSKQKYKMLKKRVKRVKRQNII